MDINRINTPVSPPSPPPVKASKSAPAQNVVPEVVIKDVVETAAMENSKTQLQAEVHPIETTSVEPDVYIVSDNVFSLFKTSDGKVRARIRNLETGEVTYTPPIDGYTFYQTIRAKGGNFEEMI